MPYTPNARVLFNLSDSGLGTNLAGPGDSGPIDLADITDVWLAVYAAGTSTGTSPTLDVQLDVQDADGNWLPQVAKVTQLTSAPGYASASAGLHIASTGSTVLPQWARVSWATGGTDPEFPQTSICLYGR